MELPVLAEVELALEGLGLAVEAPTATLRQARTALVTLRARSLPDGLRVEAVLLQGVTRNKLALWNVASHNNAQLPFGQFYIDAEGDICFGGLWPTALYRRAWLPVVLQHLVQVAENYRRLVHADYREQAFDPTLRTLLETLDLFPTAFETDTSRLVPSEAAAAEWLADQLPLLVDARQVVRLSDTEFAVAHEGTVTQVQLLNMPPIRRGRPGPNWQLACSTEIGVLNHTDDPLWVLINYLNHDSFLLAYGVKYLQRKPVLWLRSTLPAECLSDPTLLRLLLNLHRLQAPRMFAEMEKPYRIQSSVGYTLGL